MNSNDTNIYSAFFMEGLSASNYGEMLEAWGQGCYELVSEICEYAPRLQRMVEAAFRAKPDLDYPGVFEYEVCAPFGTMINQSILDAGDTPSEVACMDWLKEEVINFFCQSDSSCRAQIEDAVRSIE